MLIQIGVSTCMFIFNQGWVQNNKLLKHSRVVLLLYCAKVAHSVCHGSQLDARGTPHVAKIRVQQKHLRFQSFQRGGASFT